MQMLNLNQSVKAIAHEILTLKEDPILRSQVENRISEFLDTYEKDTYAWFEELTYCLLTAYSSARMGQICTDALCDRGILINGNREEVEYILKSLGHRFAEKRTEYIVKARELAPNLKPQLQSFDEIKKAREWLVENVKGLGWKESSHFLRNVGYLDVAIIDRHIISNMVEHRLIPDRPKSITKKRYLDFERLLGVVANHVGMTLGEMDLYLWYRKTGEVLK